MQWILSIFQTYVPLIIAGAGVVITVIASGHAILYKRDSRAAVAWVGLIWLAPFLGTILYVLLGINRVRRRVAGRRGHESVHYRALDAFACRPRELHALLPAGGSNMVEMARLGGALSQMPLLRDNRVEPLIDGDEAYPAMLDAIASARVSVTLAVYIFDNDSVGEQFLRALARAVKRGVEVCVLIDAVGVRYSTWPISGRLRRNGVRTAHFMSGTVPWRTPYINLRNHRKIMVVDGTIGFTGGMNIRDSHLLGTGPAYPTHDMHFRVTGPVVQQLQATFVEDWQFTTGELLSGDQWFPEPAGADGPVYARVIPDGPDRDMNKMTMAFQGALAAASHSVTIMTPYFLPDRDLISALNTCNLRGVQVDVVLPLENNLKMIAWASMAQMWQILEWGCRVWLTPPPFDHSKIMVVDGLFSLVGSSNWDPRSLRLNFELGLECYDTELARKLEARIAERMRGAHRLTLAEVDNRPALIKLRDGVVRLAAPYL
ncbi:MAG: cardiolipin synthase [Spirochaetaceae bacterium]|nr:MAG: cardiolipin synthase [Spirochaetaceae bacterium]